MKMGERAYKRRQEGYYTLSVFLAYHYVVKDYLTFRPYYVCIVNPSANRNLTTKLHDFVFHIKTNSLTSGQRLKVQLSGAYLLQLQNKISAFYQLGQCGLDLCGCGNQSSEYETEPSSSINSFIFLTS